MSLHCTNYTIDIIDIANTRHAIDMMFFNLSLSLGIKFAPAAPVIVLTGHINRHIHM